MLWFLLLFTLLEVKVDSILRVSLPLQTSHNTFEKLPFMDENLIKLPLYADWINVLKDQIVLLRNDSLIYYSLTTFSVDSAIYLNKNSIDRIYTDKKDRVILLSGKKSSFYINGKKARVQFLPDTMNIIRGKRVSLEHYRSPVIYYNFVLYLDKRGRVVLKIPFDSSASSIVNLKYEVLPSFIAYDDGAPIVYTFDGKLLRDSSLVVDNLPKGIASLENDTLFIYTFKDSVYTFTYPDIKFIGMENIKATPFNRLRSNLKGEVYFKGKVIYKDKELVSANLYDIDSDGKKEIILGRMDGTFAVLKEYNGSYQEYKSYMPLEDLYERYFPVSGFPLFYFAPLSNTPFAPILDTLNPMYLDEYLYILQHASVEFIDTLMRLGIDYLYQNIFDIYLAAKRLKYVDLFELPDGRTTLILNKKDTIPSEIYYEYVVFPRVLYEFPIKPFFRDFFMNDRSFGKTVIEVVAEDTLIEDAIHSFYRWARSFMHFGYMTNDLQPVKIYEKAYGSCGEHSILSAALLKTILIPVYIAVNMGEDHQWNEFYNGKRWIHFDLTQEGEEKAIDNPFASSEGLGNKEVSTVLGVSPTGRYFPITSHGYTNTGRVNVFVRDKNNEPVPFALVVLRSHWNRRNSISSFKYTDKNGYVHFDVGKEELGYGIEVFSPYGKGGIGNFYIEEGCTIDLVTYVAGEIPRVIGKKKVAKMLVLGKNFRTRETLVFYDEGFLYQNEDGSVFNPYLNTWGILIEKDTIKKVSQPPSLKVELEDSVVRNGMPLFVKVQAYDNLGIKSIRAIIYNDKVKKEFNLHVLNGVDTIFVNEDTVLQPGIYSLTFIAEDFADNKRVIEKVVKIEKSFVFKMQRIRQDPIGTNKGSWNYEFDVKDTLPFLFIQTKGRTDRMDIDLFLKKSGKIIKKSTSPTANESIYYHPLTPGRYIITVQGWYVPNKKGIFDIKVVY